jgi:hypothetical protein
MNETTKSKVFAGLSTRKPNSKCISERANQVVLQVKIEPSSPPKIKKDEKARIPPAVATDNKAEIFPCLRRKHSVTAAEIKGKNSKLSATCIMI